MIDISKTRLIFDFSAEGKEDITQCLKVLFSVYAGTVPLDRGLGIDISVTDMPSNRAMAAYSADIANKIRRYEPRIKINEISFDADALNGALYPRVVLSLA